MNLASLKRRAKHATQDALAACGIELHRTELGQRRTMTAVLAHYRRLGLAPATVIDVGVGTGTPDLYQAFPTADLLLIEPLEEWRGYAEQIARTRPTQIALVAAGPRAGEREITVHRAPVCSSLLGTPRDENHYATRSVPVARLDDLIAEARLPGPFVIKADVEGGELDVLTGGLGALRDTELVLLEVSLFQFLPGAPQLFDVVAWMHEHRFAVADLYHGHNRPLDGSLARLDIAFVQEEGQFRSNHAYATPAQADALYRSWGF